MTAVGAGVALACLALPVGNAAAATSNDCPQAGSTRLVTGDVAGTGFSKLWVYSPTSTRTIVCMDFAPSLFLWSGAIVADTGTALVPPTVTLGTSPAACTVTVVNVLDPVPFRIALGAAGSTICFTANSSTTTITFTGPGNSTLPSIEVWTNGSGWIDLLLCAQHLPDYYTGNQQPYYDCARNRRIV